MALTSALIARAGAGGIVGSSSQSLLGSIFTFDLTLGATSDYGANGIDMTAAAVLQMGGATNAISQIVQVLQANIRTSGNVLRFVQFDFDVANKTLRFFKTDLAILASASTSTTSAASGAETIVGLYAMPANTINALNQGLYLTAWGTLAADGNTKTFKVKLGATGTLGGAPTGGFDLTGGGITTTGNNVSWVLNANLLRTGSATQVGAAELTAGAAAAQFGAGQATNGTQDFTTALQVVVTGASNAAAADVTLNGMVIQYAGTAGAGLLQEVIPSSDLAAGDIARVTAVGI